MKLPLTQSKVLNRVSPVPHVPVKIATKYRPLSKVLNSSCIHVPIFGKSITQQEQTITTFNVCSVQDGDLNTVPFMQTKAFIEDGKL
jgi:hypothetical protein